MSQLVETFYSGQYLTLTDKGLTVPGKTSAVTGWSIQQYGAEYPLGETVQLSNSITCTAIWKELSTKYLVTFYDAYGTRILTADQYVMKEEDAVPPSPPSPPNPHLYFDHWVPPYTHITADTSCIPTYNSFLSAQFEIQLDDNPPELSGCDEYEKYAFVQYPTASTIQYYQYLSAQPPSIVSIEKSQQIIYHYESNKFERIDYRSTYEYDGRPHGLEVTAHLNHTPGILANVSYSESLDGPWGISPTVIDPGESALVYYKLQFDNYPDMISSRVVSIGQAKTLTFTFKDRNGDSDERTWQAAYNEVFTLPEDITSLYLGHTFTGWNPTGVLDKPITADHHLTAQYDTNAYTCHFFNYDKTEWIKSDGTRPTSTAEYQTSFSQPDPFDTKKEIDPRHFIFSGWFDYYTGVIATADLTSAVRNISVEARYNHIVLFNLTVSADETYKLCSDVPFTYGVPILPGVDIALPTVPNYAFSHFSPQESEWQQMTADVDVIAVYETDIKTATFHANYVGAPTELSTLVGPAETVFDDTPYAVFNADRTGYGISSWNTDAQGTGDEIPLQSFVLLKNEDYYAQWEHYLYLITYSLLGGTIVEGADISSYYYGDEKLLPTNVVKDGSTFLGWEDEQGVLQEKIVSTDIGDKSFFAKWEIN